MLPCPEHTRNDVHLPFFDWGSPYEDWTSQFTDKNFSLTDKLMSENKKPLIYPDLNTYFDDNAIYSNNNFFSKDTIFDNKYAMPVVINGEKKIDGMVFISTKDNNKREILLARKYKTLDPLTLEFVDPYSIKDDKFLVLNNYWSLLSEQAVLSGAGVVKLFFDDVKKEKNSKVLLSKNTSFFGKMLASIGSIFSSNENEPSTSNLSEVAPQQSLPNILTSDVSISEPSLSADAETVPPPPPPSSPPPPVSPPVTSVNPSPQSFTPSLPYPGFGGGGGPAPSSAQDSSSPQESSLPTPSTPPPPTPPASPSDTTPSNPPIITSPNDFSQIFTLPAIVFSGTAEAQSIISNDFNNSTTTADLSGVWSLAINLNQGTTTIKFFSQDAAGNISSSTDVSLFVDSTAPSIDSFSILECSESFSSDTCLLATTTIHLLWQASADDLDYFELIQNGVAGNITATSTIVAVQDNSLNTFSIRAKDKAGNWSASQIVNAEISTMPVVINEVAWGGTAGHSYDEWIELYNRTSRTINLNNWTLYTQSQTPYIRLSGSIPANGYYLLERKDDDTVSNITADLIYGNDGASWALNNTGETLILSFASTTIDQTAVTSDGWWPAGTANGRTMERYDPDLAGNIVSNWGTNNMVIRKGKTASPEFWDINGTAKARNSINYWITNDQVDIASNLTLTKSKSPYLVDNRVITVNASIILTIEPGVVIKFYNNAGMRVFGKIISQGTASEPVVFTAFSDDAYGGDLDATSTIPIAGSWYGVDILSGDSIFDNTIFRYGGKYYSGMDNVSADLSVKNFSATITNSVFEYSKVYGLRLINSNTTISNSNFRDNSAEGGSTGLSAEAGSSVFIQSSSFSNNRIGVSYSNSPIQLQNVRFENNNLGISADSLSASMPISVSSVEFLGTGATTSPSGLW